MRYLILYHFIKFLSQMGDFVFCVLTDSCCGVDMMHPARQIIQPPPPSPWSSSRTTSHYLTSPPDYPSSCPASLPSTIGNIIPGASHDPAELPHHRKLSHPGWRQCEKSRYLYGIGAHAQKDNGDLEEPIPIPISKAISPPFLLG